MVFTRELTAKSGPIWDKRPTLRSGGLVAAIGNRRHHPDRPRPVFKTVAFSFNGDTVATVDGRGHLVVFHLLRNLYEHVKHLGAVGTALTFSNKRLDELFVGLADSTVQVINVRSKSLTAVLKGHKHAVTSISLNPAGTLLMTASVDCAMIWSTANWARKRVLTFSTGIFQAVFHPASELLAVGFMDDTVLVWDSVTYDRIARLTVPASEGHVALSCMTMSPDSRFLLAGSRKGACYLWEIRSQSLVRVVDLPQPSRFVLQAQFLPNGRVAAILGDDGRILFASVAAAVCRSMLEISVDNLALLGYHIEPAGRYMASLTSDGRLLVHDIEAARRQRAMMREAQRRMGLPREELDAVLPARKVSGGTTHAETTELVDDAQPAPPRLARDGRGDPGEVGYPHFPSQEAHPSTAPARNPWFGPDEPEPEDLATPLAGDKAAPIAPVKSSLIEAAFPERPASAPAAPGGAPSAKFSQAHLEPANKSAARRTLGMPLFQVAALQPEEVAVNQQRLRSLLGAYGEFPAKFRLLIWRFLLRLPENHEAFRVLVDRGVHPSMADLHTRYPLKNAALFRRLRRILSAVAFWSPVFGELPFLPALAFPFVKLFEKDELACFETILTILSNWAANWVETFPHAPLQLLGSVEAMLVHHDPALADALHTAGIDAQGFAWTLMRTLFCEVFTRAEWLRFWDHLVMNADNPGLLALSAVAYVTYFRSSILAMLHARGPTPAGESTQQQVISFLRHQNAIDMDKFLRHVYHLRQSSPTHLLTAENGWPGYAPSPGALMPAGDVADGGPLHVLPQGNYPPFLHYPKFVVDYQLQERDRILAEEEELRRRTALLEQLATKSNELEAEEHAWRSTRETLVKSEEARRQRMLAAQAHRDQETRRISAEARQRRLEQIAKMQDAARAALAARRAAQEAQIQRQEDELRLQLSKEEQEIQDRLQEEALLNIEYQTHQRLQELKLERAMEDDVTSFEARLEAQQKAAQLDEKLLHQAWRTEDEERRLKRQLAEEAVAQQTEQQAAAKRAQELELQQLLSGLDREVRLGSIMRERKLRHVAEDTVFDVQAALAEDRRKEEILRKEDVLASRRLMMDEARHRQDDTDRRLRVLETERAKRQAEVASRKQRLMQLEHLQARQEFEEELLRRRVDELTAVRAEERDLQAALALIEQERQKDTEFEMKMMLKQQDLKARLDMQRRLSEQEHAALERDRAAFRERLAQANTEAAATAAAVLRSQQQQQQQARAAGVAATGRVASVPTPSAPAPAPAPASAGNTTPAPAWYAAAGTRADASPQPAASPLFGQLTPSQLRAMELIRQRHRRQTSGAAVTPSESSFSHTSTSYYSESGSHSTPASQRSDSRTPASYSSYTSRTPTDSHTESSPSVSGSGSHDSPYTGSGSSSSGHSSRHH